MITEPMALEEWTLLDELRNIPDDDARADVTARILDLIRYGHDPLCPHAQADGVPCTSANISCEECHARQDLV
jgi:hypothetical protein